jgi:hypothetical protein
MRLPEHVPKALTPQNQEEVAVTEPETILEAHEAFRSVRSTIEEHLTHLHAELTDLIETRHKSVQENSIRLEVLQHKFDTLRTSIAAHFPNIPLTDELFRTIIMREGREGRKGSLTKDETTALRRDYIEYLALREEKESFERDLPHIHIFDQKIRQYKNLRELTSAKITGDLSSYITTLVEIQSLRELEGRLKRVGHALPQEDALRLEILTRRTSEQARLISGNNTTPVSPIDSLIITKEMQQEAVSVLETSIHAYESKGNTSHLEAARALLAEINRQAQRALNEKRSREHFLALAKIKKTERDSQSNVPGVLPANAWGYDTEKRGSKH